MAKDPAVGSRYPDAIFGERLTDRIGFAAFLVKVTFQLAIARVRLTSFHSDQLAGRNAVVADICRGAKETERENALVARVKWTVPRVAYRMPFRSDCLVQAMAAQSLLCEDGVATRIMIGVKRHPDRTFESHAWLLHRKSVMLGGDVEGFQPIADP